MKIVDCFIFNDELRMLDFRLAEMSHAVDYHVLVEANRTISGNPKALHFSNNTPRYATYLDKIIDVTVEDMPRRDISPPMTEEKLQYVMLMEHHQRRCIDRGVKRLDLQDEDIILLTDCDEIPDSKTLAGIRTTGLPNGVFALSQAMYYYDWTCSIGEDWLVAKAVNFRTYRAMDGDCQAIRAANLDPGQILRRGGWHCSYFGGPNAIVRKLQTFSHQEFNNPKYLDKEQIREIISRQGDVLLRPLGPYHYVPIDDNTYLPDQYNILLKTE